jgi:hypothetical protein
MTSIWKEYKYLVATERIRQQLADLGPEDIQSQNQSIFFRLPAELRNMIYDLVLQQQFDTKCHNLSRYRQFHRPLFRQSRLLLATCRRIFLEARKFGLQNYTLTYPLSYNVFRWGRMRKEDLGAVRHLILTPALLAMADDLIYFKRRHPSFRPCYVTLRIDGPFTPWSLILQNNCSWTDAIYDWSVDAVVLEVLAEVPVS